MNSGEILMIVYFEDVKKLRNFFNKNGLDQNFKYVPILFFRLKQFSMNYKLGVFE